MDTLVVPRQRGMAHSMIRLTSFAAACWAALLAASAQVNVLTWHNDLARTGANTNETVLTPANVNSNSFGLFFLQPVDGHIYGQPLYVSGLSVPGLGTRNVVFVVTQHNSVYAFDADSNAGANGGLIWHVNFGPSALTPNGDFGNRYGPYHDINPEVGITSTPVIDLASGTLYLDAFTHEGAAYYHRIHALNITNGTEQSFSPVVVSASLPGTGVGSANGQLAFSAIQHLQRPALTLAGGVLYVAYSGYADTDPYHGWVLGFDPSTLAQLTNYVFNTTPNSSIATYGSTAGEGGIWMAGAGLGVDAQNNLYFEVGNGVFNASDPAGTEYGDSFIKLSTQNQLAVADYFTPYNQASLSASDTDVGSGGLVLLPDSVGSAAHPHLVAGCGKEGTVYLLDRDNLGHFNASADSQVVQELPGAVGGGTWSSPAYFNGRIYYQGVGDVMKAFRIANALLSTSPVSLSATSFGYPGATPSISANGTNNAIAWALQTDGYPGGPSILHAYEAYNLAQELYNTTQAGARDSLPGAVKFTVPTIANGKVYVGAQKALAVLGSGSFVALPVISPAGGVFSNSVTVTLTESTPGAAIYYTLDYSTPSTNSPVYGAPLNLTNSAVLKVMASKPGFVPSQVVVATFINSASLVFSEGFLKQEFYANATRAQLEDPSFSQQPTFVNYLNSFETPSGQGINYAERVSGYFTPALTTNYVFFICSDDDSDLFLSTDSNPGNEHLIAAETSWSNSRQWLSSSGGSVLASKRSDQFTGTTWPGGPTIGLQAGNQYYIEAVHHQGVGGDDLAVTVKTAGVPDPINGSASTLTGTGIATYASTNTFVSIITPPHAAIAVQGQTATFTLEAVSGYLGGGSPPPALLYQWQSLPSGGSIYADLPNATAAQLVTRPLTLADNGAQFRCVASTAGSSATCVPAGLIVVRDTTPPAPLRINSVSPDGRVIALSFTESMDRASTENAADYLFNPGAEVPTNAVLDPSGSVVTLTSATALTPNVTNVLSISGARDLSGNSVPANSTISFSFHGVSYAAAILVDQPIGYYRFEEPAGSPVATNSGSTGGDGAYYTGNEPSPGVGGSPSSAKGASGPRPPAFGGFAADNHSASFDGVGEWVDTRNQFLQGLAAFSLECWVAPNGRAAFPNRVGIVGQNDATEFGFIDPNTIDLWTPNGGALGTAYAFPDGEWHQVVTTGDGTSIATYYDGALQGTGGNSTTAYGQSAYFVHIGGGGVFDPTGNWFQGNIDEVAIFDKALSASRIADHYLAGKSGAVLLTNGVVTPNVPRFTSITLAAGQAVLQWTGTGTLEEATNITGPWSTSNGQQNPQFVPASGTRFYRIRQ
jgi:concanavalin A-like lectin/glucanase superfamily protein/chitobiase/beta-hexosaminidase-like protein/Big-like domain-containing protein